MEQLFLNLENNAWYGKYFKKLTVSDKKLSIDFLNSLTGLNKDDAMEKVNRMFLGKDKPKNWKLINELCSVVITKS